MSITFGCHGSTWEPDYDKVSDRLDHILDVIAHAGFKGIDAQISLLGRYTDAPEKLKQALDERGLSLAAVTLPFSWLGDTESMQEQALANKFIKWVHHFPGALLNIAPRLGPNRDNLLTRQKQIVRCANAMAKRARQEGVICSFHPSSPSRSYFRTAEDYEVLFELLDPRYISWTPDAGHIASGGMDVLATVERHIDFVRHVHIKDASRAHQWRAMGTGDIPFPELVRLLLKHGYHGWIMVEEETAESLADPDPAIHAIAKYVSTKLQPIVNKRQGE